MQTRITANEAALIQRNLVASAIRVAKCDRAIAKLRRLADVDPEFRALSRQLEELRDHALPMLVCDMACAQVAA